MLVDEDDTNPSSHHVDNFRKTSSTGVNLVSGSTVVGNFPVYYDYTFEAENTEAKQFYCPYTITRLKLISMYMVKFYFVL